MENFTDHQLQLYSTLIGMRPSLMGVKTFALVSQKICNIFHEDMGISFTDDEQGEVIHRILVDYDMIKVEFTPVAPVRAKSGHEVI